MIDTLLVREATRAERPAVAEVVRLSYAEYAREAQPDFLIKYEASTRQTCLEDEVVHRLVALRDGQIVAAVLFCPPYEFTSGQKLVQNPYPEMRLLAVLPEFRNLKIGAHLIDLCQRRALAEGFDALTLHTTDLMQTAMAMYERRGFKRYSQIDFSPVPGFLVRGYIKQLDGPESQR